MTPERYLKKKIRDFLLSQRAYVFAPVNTGLGAVTVDLLVCYMGTFIAIEVKVGDNKPTVRQNLVLTQVEDAGGISFWCNSWDNFRERWAYHTHELLL